MGTSSRITVKCMDGKYRSVYCHYDGYVNHNGKMLVTHYNSQELAEKLVAGGGMSSLDKLCDAVEGHSFTTPMEGYTVYYCRDRGEELDIIVQDHLHGIPREDYNYMWDGEKWMIGDKSVKGVLEGEYD